MNGAFYLEPKFVLEIILSRTSLTTKSKSCLKRTIELSKTILSWAIFKFTLYSYKERERNKGSRIRRGRGGGLRGKGQWGYKDFGAGKHDLNPAGAVVAPTVCCHEDLWLFSYQH